MYKRIIASVLAFVTAFSLFPTQADASGEYSSTGNIWTAFMQWEGFSGIWDVIVGLACEEACAFSEDSVHHGSLISYTPNSDGTYNALCQYCSSTFKVYDADLEAAYNGFTQEVEEEYGTTHFNQDGLFTIYPHGWTIDSSSTYTLDDTSTGFEFKCYSVQNNVNYGFEFTSSSFDLPFGQYRLSVEIKTDLSRPSSSASYFVPTSAGSGSNLGYLNTSALSSGSAAKTFDVTSSTFKGVSAYGLVDMTITAGSDSPSVVEVTYRIDCLTLLDTDSYTAPVADTRPTSITGNYGIIGDDGSLTKIDATTIVNEGDSIYYNPVTNTSHDLSGWIYDYSTRTYDLTTADDNSVTVTYGDEHISITEGDTTYNVYYLVQAPDTGDDSGESGGSGSGSGSDDSHTHDYTSEITTAASCLLPGVRTYTCSCGDTYTKSIPATGHAWAISQQVNTTYDPDTGELLQQGYTVYVCNTCGEQYKDEGGTGPPNGSSGDSEGEGIWDKIGNLIGTIFDGILGLIEGVLGGMLDGLISLASMLADKLSQVVDVVMSLFAEIPAMFSGFLDFLSAVFPFLPEEIMTLLTFGLAAVIFLGILGWFRR